MVQPETRGQGRQGAAATLAAVTYKPHPREGRELRARELNWGWGVGRGDLRGRADAEAVTFTMGEMAYSAVHTSVGLGASWVRFLVSLPKQGL